MLSKRSPDYGGSPTKENLKFTLLFICWAGSVLYEPGGRLAHTLTQEPVSPIQK